MSQAQHLADQIQATLIGLDEVARAAEAKWGVGRLVRLVSDTTRLRFRQANLLLGAAIADNDPARVTTQAAMMRRAWAALDAEATQAGAATLSPVVWEAETSDGRVIAIVRTQAEAAAVATDGRHVEVWSLSEVANVLARHSVVSAIKAEFSGARVERTVQRSEGFAQDWATNDPLLEMIRENEMQLPPPPTPTQSPAQPLSGVAA